MRVITEKTLRIDIKYDIFMYLPVDVETGIVNTEVVPVPPILSPYARAAKTDAEGHPLGIVDGPLGLADGLEVVCSVNFGQQ